jgi:hypothetical protein
MLGGEFIIHGSDPRLQTTNLVVNDPKFPGLEGVTSPVEFTEEWYRRISRRTCTSSSPSTPVNSKVSAISHSYPGTWRACTEKAGSFTALGDRPENWELPSLTY